MAKVDEAQAEKMDRGEEQSDAYTRAHDKIGEIKVRRLSAMDIAMLRRNQNKFVMGFTTQFVEEMNADTTKVATLAPDICQFIWLFKAKEEEYLLAVQDNDYYLRLSIQLAREIDYDELVHFIPDIQRIVNESRRAQVKEAPKPPDHRAKKNGRRSR